MKNEYMNMLGSYGSTLLELLSFTFLTEWMYSLEVVNSIWSVFMNDAGVNSGHCICLGYYDIYVCFNVLLMGLIWLKFNFM